MPAPKAIIEANEAGNPSVTRLPSTSTQLFHRSGLTRTLAHRPLAGATPVLKRFRGQIRQQLLLNPARVHAEIRIGHIVVGPPVCARAKICGFEHRLVEGHHGGHAVNVQFGERAFGTAQAFGARGALTMSLAIMES